MPQSCGVVNNKLSESGSGKEATHPITCYTRSEVYKTPGAGRDRPRADLDRVCRVRLTLYTANLPSCLRRALASDGLLKEKAHLLQFPEARLYSACGWTLSVAFVLTPPLSSCSSSLHGGLSLGMCAPSLGSARKYPRAHFQDSPLLVFSLKGGRGSIDHTVCMQFYPAIAPYMGRRRAIRTRWEVGMVFSVDASDGPCRALVSARHGENINECFTYVGIKYASPRWSRLVST